MGLPPNLALTATSTLPRSASVVAVSNNGLVRVSTIRPHPTATPLPAPRQSRQPVVGVTGAAVLPVAPHDHPGTGQTAVLEEVAADALHRRRLAGGPDPRSGRELAVGDSGHERVTGCGVGRQIEPVDGGMRMV
jgi:hypothetical protein